ncbi:MAG: bifunctional metallophosphatase/5'-nucleotidase, partial [Phormidesmis priestleyi]
MATLVADGLYVNLHTENNPGGELRGQIDIDLNNPANFAGTQFPYLSSNLDFSTDSNLADLVVPDDQPPQPNSIAASVVIDVNGEKIGVVGATTPLLRSLSSPGNVGISPQPFDGVPTAAQLDALAAEIQKDVDELIAANPGLDKVVLLSHMQQISIEQALATRLKNVDVIVAGGSNTRLLDDNDRLRPGDTKQGEYPIFSTDADGKPIAIVNTDGNYKYVGRLVVDFDANGNIIPGSYDSAVSGAYATDAQGVVDLNAQGLVDPEIQAIVDALRTNIIGKESNVFGLSDVYLNGDRSGVRIEETNFGNLTADANLALAKQTDATTIISLKNGGGIRDSIGQVIVPTGSTGDVVRLSNEAVTDANGNIVKPTGGISQNDIANALSFNNGLTLATVPAAGLLAIIEHGVAASTAADSNTQGRFPQVAGIEFSFDLTQSANDRVQSLVVLDETGKDADIIVRNGALVGDPNRTFRMVTLGFLATGGDLYPFPTGPAANVVNLTQADSAPRTGQATFAADGSEQDALAEYFAANFSTTPFDMADAPRSADTRIQNLAFRADTVIDSLMAPTVSFNSNNLFAIPGNGTTQIKATLSGRISETVGEIIAIATDDENGTIDGIAPGGAGYQAAALSRSTVVLSTLSASEFGDLNPMRTFDVMGGKFLQFATIKGGTLGDLINGRGGEIIFATPAANGNGQSAIANPNVLSAQSV